MQAWILDESPGAYRWGSIDLPELADDDVAIRVVTSALNHMDLWVTRGAPKPPLPHVPGSQPNDLRRGPFSAAGEQKKPGR